MAGLARTNCWTIAEHAGERDPRGMQRLLSQTVWDEDVVRDDTRGYVTEHFGDGSAVLVVDETGDVKKGTATVGVQRQYTGTAGRMENSQVAVYLTYAACWRDSCSAKPSAPMTSAGCADSVSAHASTPDSCSICADQTLVFGDRLGF